GKEITVEKGTTIIQAAEKLDISIPHYCYHPGLSIAGNCRMCLVEVERMPKPQIACHIQCQDGMVVKTQTETVKKLRQHVLEFLLVNHPLDCPVCDQAGECWLQDYYMKHGLYDSRLDENKVKKSAKAFPIGPTIMLDTERCILCSRCVRFTDEITKTGEFGIFNRGDHSEIGVYPGRELDNLYSGNVADICPVGALTDRDFRFKCRVWYLEKTESVCPGCARGCNMTIETNQERPHHAHGERVMRLKPRYNDEVNDWWICDQGRYGYKFIDHDRITDPVRRFDGMVKAIEWKEMADGFVKSFRKILKDSKDEIAVFLSPQMTNEELYLAKKLFVKELGIERVLLVSANLEGNQDDFLIRADKHPNRKGAELIGFKEEERMTKRILDEASKGTFKAMIIFGQDLVSLYPDRNMEDILHGLSLSIFIGSNHNLTSEHVQFVMPAATYAEKNGTFTNFEKRVQRIRQALQPLGESKPESEILMLLARKLDLDWPYESQEDIFEGLRRSISEFQGMTYAKIGKEGVKIS
ncbi:MAG: (2Fe-2S)-binding protein, partial [Candidatus Omnitrophica bacterium]|nr:(2Fe-2S)-binding protein [Candidatus Omnitrophota bacterium]